MVVGLAFVAVVVSSLFAQSMLVRYTADHQPQHRAWAIALAMFALASVALASGSATGWDNGTFRAFYLLGAVVNVPWLAMGTVYLLVRAEVARRVLWGLVLFSGFAAGVLLSCPMETVHGTAIPVGKDVFGALPRILAAAGSGIAAVVIIAGALVSAWRFLRNPGITDHGRLAARECPDRAGCAGAVERRPDPGRRRPRRGVRHQPRRRHHDRLLRVRAGQRAPEDAHCGEISRRVIFNSRHSGAPSILGARASPGGKLDGSRYASAGGVEIGSPRSTKPPSPPQAHLHSPPGANFSGCQHSPPG